MSMASDSEVILQRLISVTSDILISTSTCCHTAIILIFIFLAILDSVLYSCYLSITSTSDSKIKYISSSFIYKESKISLILFITKIFYLTALKII